MTNLNRVGQHDSVFAFASEGYTGRKDTKWDIGVTKRRSILVRNTFMPPYGWLASAPAANLVEKEQGK